MSKWDTTRGKGSGQHWPVSVPGVLEAHHNLARSKQPPGAVASPPIHSVKKWKCYARPVAISRVWNDHLSWIFAFLFDISTVNLNINTWFLLSDSSNLKPKMANCTIETISVCLINTAKLHIGFPLHSFIKRGKKFYNENNKSENPLAFRAKHFVSIRL